MHNSNNRILVIIALVIFALLGGGIFYLYNQFSKVQSALQELQQQTKAIPDQTTQEVKEVLEEAPLKLTKGQLWASMQSQLKDTVVQVFAQMTEFNWTEPYKTPSQNEALGTAFFINKEGDLLTNAHVVDQAIVVHIQVPSIGKRKFEVDVVGVHPERDLALLRLKKNEVEALKKALNVKEFPYVRMGNSDAVQRGDKIMALGYPLGQQGLKSTTGVVSGREHLMGHYFIQISAPINKGNSGGPSLDKTGRVIGVNTAGIPGAQNVGYIIPINEVLLFLDQIGSMPKGQKTHLIKKPYLGVILSNANENLVSYLGNPQPGGIYVVEVTPSGPFAKAGIQGGDMIYKIDGYAVDMYGEMTVPWSKEDRLSLADYVARLKLGKSIAVDYYRKGTAKKATVVLSSADSPIRRMYPGYEKMDYEVLAGFVFMPLTLNHVILLAQFAPDLMRFADAKKQLKPALLITHVLLNSPGARARAVGAGGVISEVNGQKVTTLDEFRAAALKSIKSGYFTIRTVDNQFAVLSLNEIMEDEPRLSATSFYPLSDTYKELRRQLGGKTTTKE